MHRAYYNNTISRFCDESANHILGVMAAENQFTLLGTQRDAWQKQVNLLQSILKSFEGKIYLEYSIPRMGKRVDVLLIIQNVIFVIEFKVGASSFLGADLDQVVDYSLDLRNFHEGSHTAHIAPVLVATGSDNVDQGSVLTSKDKIFDPILCNGDCLDDIILSVLSQVNAGWIDVAAWEASGYKPTPTIIEATLALYNGHSVVDISRSDAGAINLTTTSTCIKEIIQQSRAKSEKAIVFVTGVLILPTNEGHPVKRVNYATEVNHDKQDRYEKDHPAEVRAGIPGRGVGLGRKDWYFQSCQGAWSA